MRVLVEHVEYKNWRVRIGEQVVGVGPEASVSAFADELRSQPDDFLACLAEQNRVLDARCECGHQGRNHGHEGERDSCYYRKACGCTGWKETS